MDLRSIGRLVSERRRSKGLTLHELAAEAEIGRSTLAALEAGKLAELGFAKVARLCTAIGLVIDVGPRLLDAPLMQHRHLTDEAALDLTKAAIEDVILRGGIPAWRGLIRAAISDESGRIGSRVRQVTAALDRDDPKVRAFATLLPDLMKIRPSRRVEHGQEA